MRRDRRRGIALLLALLVVLAGCGSVVDGGDGTTAESTTEATENTLTTPGDGASATATTSATPAPPATTTDGEGAARASILSDHAAAVRSAGGYVATFTHRTTRTDGRVVTVNGTLEETVDPRERLLSVVYDYPNLTEPEAQYLPPGSETAVGCSEPSGTECVASGEFPANATAMPPFNLTVPPWSGTPGAAIASYADDGLVSTDGGERRRYVATDLEEVAEPDDEWTLVNASATLLVDPETGRISSFEYARTKERGGEQFSVRYAVEYTQFGNVSITAPEWYGG